uniref:CCHC-type domain-containing protein n=1 Tax=Fagus sylvatica TaxID=28930 RepID=A0A2N9GC57_FAGSY
MLWRNSRLAVIYEGVSLLCFHCGKIGHRRERCPIRALEESELPSANDQSSLVEEDKPKGFGLWMIVARRKRQTKPVGSLDHAEGPSAVQGHANAQQHGFGATDQLAGSSDAMRQIAPAVQEEDPPLLTDMVWMQEISPFWNFLTDTSRIDGIHCPLRVRCQPSRELRFVQFLEEVYCATLPEFKERKVLLSIPIQFNWVGNRKSLKLAQIAKCVPLFNLSDPLLGAAGGGVSRVSVYLRHEIGVNTLTWNCRGVLNPCFRKALLDTLHINNPEILILTETRLGGDRAAELARSFPFDGFLCTNTIRFARVKVRGFHSLWLISAIYGSPRRSECRILWENLKIIAGLNNLPWVMLGDFNDILLCEEKWGGNRPSNSRIREFRNCLNACNMIDLGFSSPKYTWSNCHDMNYLIMERLDKVLANPDWRILFPEASVTHLTRTHSDHCSVLLTLCPNIPCILPRPFRFKSIWFSHVDFPSIVEKAWATPALNLSITFAIFAGLVSAWNKTKFDANDVKKSLWSLKAFKAPGPDGLHPGFFQKCWPTVGDLVVNKAAFVPGRRGLDNVVIAQELIHSIHRKKGRMGQLILKLDLEKAYDRLEWDLHPGIRQGDPLSPYLFILCMEYLSLKILEACDNNSWKAIKASRTGPSFLHLFFTDDLLLCTKASSNCCHIITRILEDFCLQFGQKISLSKSKVFFSPNVNPILRHHLCGILGVSSTHNLGKYLGFPLRSNGRSTRDFDFVVEKVQAKLSSWKAKLLSPTEISFGIPLMKGRKCIWLVGTKFVDLEIWEV